MKNSHSYILHDLVLKRHIIYSRPKSNMRIINIIISQAWLYCIDAGHSGLGVPSSLILERPVCNDGLAQ